MNKQLAKKGTTLNKNMTNTESLQLHDLTVTNYVHPEEPENPKEGEIYLKYYAVSDTFETMLYLNGHWI